MAKRLEEFDLLKGVGILLVVLGQSEISDPLYIMIYSFHMPLFFMVSGFFFYTQIPQLFLKKMFSRLIIPWLFFVGVNLSFSTVLSLVSSHSIIGSIKSTFNLLSPFDENCYILYRSIWFLIVLFISSNIYNLLCNLLNKRTINCTILALYFSGFALQKIVNVPFFIDTSISVLLFYHLGRLAKEYFNGTNRAILFKRNDKRMFFIMLLVFVALMCFSVLSKPAIDFKANEFPIWVPLLSVPIIVALYYMLKVLSGQTVMKSLRSFLIMCGTYSICILGFHRIFQESFNIFFNKLSIEHTSLSTIVYFIITIPLILLIAKQLEKHAPCLIGYKRV